MRKLMMFCCALLLGATLCKAAPDTEWKALWISKEYSHYDANTWLAFRKKVEADKVPGKLEARIAVDSKYWLWVNGEMVVYEGGLKRGPAPGDGYYDIVDIAPYLKQGQNIISVLVWHFGRSGFSHQNSGVAGLLFQAESPELSIYSDESWECSVEHSYTLAPGPQPNNRLPEANIRFDARKYPTDWHLGTRPATLGKAMELPFAPGKAPMGKLIPRPIPMWKVGSIRSYEATEQRGDTIICQLPYNAQVHPYLKVQAPAGKLIKFRTDHDIVTKAQCVTGEYVTCEGEQEYESFPWMNGEKVYYVVPSDVKVLSLGYRETQYDADLTGTFTCDDELLNTYWKKAARTLKVCQRDTYYDCPDRERAQWWGDEVNELGEAFYLHERKADLLVRKGMLELAGWQKADGALFAPCPASNWSHELPMQILASVGWYGFRTYAFYSGDYSFVADIYPALHRYLHELWQVDADGLPIYRPGGWDWPDAGTDRDRWAQLPPWYYLALKAEAEFAGLLGREADAEQDEAMMARLAESYNRIFWNGTAYRSKQYTEATDDRAQALAVVSGIAGPDKYDAILKVFENEAHATTYMFKYVLEALCVMGHPELALERMHRFYPTIMKDDCSTLWEHWNYDGTSNHAWSGAGAIVMAERFAGITPIEAGFKRFLVAPQMGTLKHIECAFDSASGRISITLDRKGRKTTMKLMVPDESEAVVCLNSGKTVTLKSGTHDIKL